MQEILLKENLDNYSCVFLITAALWPAFGTLNISQPYHTNHSRRHKRKRNKYPHKQPEINNLNYCEDLSFQEYVTNEE